MARTKLTSHEAFTHDSLDSLGYDWERVANPGIAPCFPCKVYLPRETEHVVAAVRETKLLSQRLWIRSKGHSSNDLVLAQDGAVLCTEKLNRVLAINPVDKTAAVQSGVVLAELDAELAQHGLGLPVIGDHNHITAGGFASVGGISPASHRHGLFVDNVLELEYVDHEGKVRKCSRDSARDELMRVLAGTGRHGVIVTLLLRVIAVDKKGALLRNTRYMTTKLQKYIAQSHALIADPSGVLFERGVWLDVPVLGFRVTVGQFSSYREAPPSAWARLRRNVSYGYLHFLGRIAGRLPNLLDVFVKYLGIVGVIFSPRYGNISDIESFTDKILDSSVGEPTRMLVVLAPVEHYEALFRELNDICVSYRTRHACFTFISFYVKAIASEYLKPSNKTGKYSELMLYLGMRPEKMPSELLDQFVSEMDDLCISRKALRYMHSKTVKDPIRVSKIDPNQIYSETRI